MKKCITLILVMMMLMSLGAAFAEAPDSPETIETVATSNESVTIVPAEEEKLEKAFVEASEKVNDEVQEAAAKKDVKSLVSEEYQEIIPEDFNTMLGTGTVLQVSEIPEDVKSLTVTFTFPTDYEKSEKVVLLVAILDENGNILEYVALDGVANEDGDVVAVVSEAMLAKLGGNKIKVYPFSKDGVARN